ncbi:hypothetical protein E2562_004736 [Oryza meyeriana var. granulata]|uniref:Uncharacterized protein n=1 Tax=Oryza meyeriana var. granulata TaxID=110450 RepID=A0A6G1DE75_9ORYZ|nr:hypothetical protein E2562_004736 [Oryza meyeriana var. granulata]
MSSQVRVLNVTHVLPDRTIAASAAAPPHAGGGGGDVIELSFLDTMFVALTPLQRLFFYEGGPDDLPPFHALVSSLKSSLATTLAVFTPLAGKLTYRPSHNDVVIDCSVAAVSPGVMFIEAEYDDSAGGVDMLRLAGDDEHHTEAFKRLVPEMEVGRLPALLLAVQVTRPADGGGGIVAVGVSLHHAVGDGQAVWQFMRAWSTASRAGSPSVATMPVVFDRKAVLRHPKEDTELARVFLRVFAPALPLDCSLFPEPDMARQWRKTYLLRPNQIQSLKQQMVALSEHAKTMKKLMKAPTTHVAVLSLYWTSLVRAKFMSNSGDGDVYFMIPGDLRRRLRPPANDGYFGNCVKPCYLRAPVGDLCAGDGLVHAAVAFQKAIRECLEEGDPLADVERWSEPETKVPKERIAQVSSSHRFMAYETDFGWGAPRRVELVSVYRMDVVALVAAAQAAGGGVQVSVALDRAHMEAFESYFLQDSDTKSDSSSVMYT